MAQDYYSILGVKRDASEKDIHSAYRRLARKYHPDVNPGDKAAEARFKEINVAHEIISDSEKRQKYDKYGENWQMAEQYEQARGQPAGQWWSTMREGGPDGGARFQGNSDNLGEFGSIFDTLFRGGGRRTRSRGPQRGQDLEQSVELTLEEAYHGTSRTLALHIQGPCETCSGSIAGTVCHVCNGSGTETKLRRIEIKIPAGVRTGSRVRIAGEGGSGFAGGTKGDLYILTTVLPHSDFERKSDDLYVDVPIPVVDAVLGGEAEVPTLRGKSVVLTIPPQTQNGKPFRLAKLGMPKLGANGNGDLYAHIRVIVPEKLGDDERKLFEQLRKLQKESKRTSGVS